MRITTGWTTHKLLNRPLGFVFSVVEDPAYHVMVALFKEGDCRVYEGALNTMRLSTDLTAMINPLGNSGVIEIGHDGMRYDMTVEPYNYTRRQAWILPGTPKRRLGVFMTLVDHTKYRIKLTDNVMSLSEK